MSDFLGLFLVEILNKKKAEAKKIVKLEMNVIMYKNISKLHILMSLHKLICSNIQRNIIEAIIVYKY